MSTQNPKHPLNRCGKTNFESETLSHGVSGYFSDAESELEIRKFQTPRNFHPSPKTISNHDWMLKYREIQRNTLASVFLAELYFYLRLEGGSHGVSIFLATLYFHLCLGLLLGSEQKFQENLKYSFLRVRLITEKYMGYYQTSIFLTFKFSIQEYIGISLNQRFFRQSLFGGRGGFEIRMEVLGVFKFFSIFKFGQS